MVSFGKVVKTAGNVVITPARIADNLVLNVVVDGSKYILTKGVPPSWIWNKIPAGFKDGVKNHVINDGSALRKTLDTVVTVLAGLAIADKVAGPDVAVYKEIFDFYANNRLLAAGLTLGVPSTAVAVYDRVKHGVPNWGRNAYGAGMVTAAALLIAMPFIGHPVGIRGVSAPEEQKPAAAVLLTQRDLEGYITSTLMPQIDAKIKSGQLTPDQLNAAVTDAVDKYVKTVLVPQMEKTVGTVTEEQRKALEIYTRVQIQMALKDAGYATGADLANTNRQIEGLGKKVDDLASKLQTPTPGPSSTPGPAPTLVVGPLERFLQGSGYIVPASVLKAAAGANSAGLSSALSVSVDVLRTFTDGNVSNGEFVTVTVSRSGVTASADYSGSTGQRNVPLKQTNATVLTSYLQSNLTPAQLVEVKPAN